MIRVNKDLVIISDELQYKACLDLHKVDKDNKPLYKTLGYYGELVPALKCCYRYGFKTVISERDVTLTEAVNLMINTINDLDNLLNSIKEV